ncbi:GTP-binding protein [Streptomyces caeruleatus]|uniref:ATP-binding protein n=1 Tax=Streptomyces caeruleatus TaxID=661399 RepID=A0A101U633_9ACTN|nr:ATP/GTP-binding protein [Streptomyces caeruleatus]KUO04803.1 ATP-binding protein [Streptomyces caeruleatus]
MTQFPQPATRATAKLVIAGGFGVGKTTAIGAVSDITPLRTEEVLTTQSTATDSLRGIEDKTTTTVAFDFGRVGWDVPDPVELYLFGTPGQPRFWSFWHDLSEGALGAVVLADTRRLESSFPAADFFEQLGLPFVIAINRFPGTTPRTAVEIREAFDVDEQVPLMFCDARNADSVAGVLITLVQHIANTKSANSALLDA